MRSFKYIFCICFFINQSIVKSQTQQWQSHYSFFNTVTAAINTNDLIVGSDNSIFIHDTQSNTNLEITTADGISGETITSLLGLEREILIGHDTGLISKINIDDMKVFNDNSIQRKITIAANRKKINNIYLNETTAYLSTGFGILEFNPISFEFGDTYYFNGENGPINVNQTIVFEDNIFAATSSGIFKSPLNNPLILQFASWEIVLEGNWKSIFEKNGIIYALKKSLEYSELHDITSSFQLIKKFYGDFQSISTNLFGTVLTFSNQIFQLNNDFEIEEIINPLDHEIQTDFTFGIKHNNIMWIGTSGSGVIKYNNQNSYENISPDGPLNNNIFDLLSTNTQIWVAHGEYDLFYNPYPLNEYGISSYDNINWNNIGYNSLLDAKSIVKIVPDPNNISTFYGCSFHSGILEIKDTNPVNILNSENSALESVSFLGPDYKSIRVRDLIFDEDSNLWTLSALIKSGLKKRDLSGNWTSIDLSSVISNYQSESGYSEMELYDDILFFGSLNNGLIGVDTSKTPPILKKITGGENGLKSDDVRVIKLDRNNYLWVGTRDGVSVLYSPNLFFENETSLNSIVVSENGNLRELLSGQFITDIEVNSNNQKWISTASSGVFLVSEDGSEILRHFTKENSPLPTSSVKTIGINDSDGKVYFGTLKGMVSYQGTAFSESKALSDVRVFPNPVRPGYIGSVIVKGLQKNSRIKITDISGNIVYEKISDGGSISWDLRTFSGNRVHSGVYILFISTEDSIYTTTEKLMVIN